MEKRSVQKLCFQALMTALVCVTTAVVQIPIPLGYMHLGNVMILIAGVCFGPATGLVAGGLGSALADLLTGYAMWVVPTLIIKCTMGYCIGRIAYGENRSTSDRTLRLVAGTVAGVLIMVAGYTVFGAILYGSVAAGLSQIPGLTLEGVLALVIFYALYAVMRAARVTKILAQMQK